MNDQRAPEKPRTPRPSAAVRATAASLALDAVAAEVSEAFARAGVESLLLKGPTVALWLYGRGQARPYTDCDLLVSPAKRQSAEAVLARLGFQLMLGDSDTPGRRQSAHPWRRAADRADVDLHRGLRGARAPEEELFATLWAGSEPFKLAGATLRALGQPARAMHVALHAIQHGPARTRPLADLTRALETLPEELWAQAARLALRLDAGEAFAAGLRMTPSGAALAQRLRLNGAAIPAACRSREILLRAEGAPNGAISIEQLARCRSRRKQLHICARMLLPTRRLMRTASPLARRGGAWLALAYLLRPAILLSRLPAAWSAWRRSGRAASSTGSADAR